MFRRISFVAVALALAVPALASGAAPAKGGPTKGGKGGAVCGWMPCH